MKVKELLELLAQQDQELEVFIEGGAFIDSVEEREEAQGRYVSIRKH